MPWPLDDGEMGGESTPPSGSGVACLLVALAAAGSGMLLLRLGSGHTPASQRFADLPEFDTWSGMVTVWLAAASAIGVAAWPAFRALAQATGRRAVIEVLGLWIAIGLLLIVQPRTVSAEASLWLAQLRLSVLSVAAGILCSPTFFGLVLAQMRLRTLRRGTLTEVAEGGAGSVVIELLWLRTALLRFLTGFAVIVTGATLGAGALRAVILADGVAPGQAPVTATLAYGATLTALSALIFVPSYLAWLDTVTYLRDQLFPLPANGMPSHDWSQGRSDFETMLSARSSAASVFAAAFGILAPLAGSLLAALIPTS
jgi:hypothetical protein